MIVEGQTTNEVSITKKIVDRLRYKEIPSMEEAVI
jgi:hypothetical protein